jgi:hypothetical protein
MKEHTSNRSRLIPSSREDVYCEHSMVRWWPDGTARVVYNRPVMIGIVSDRNGTHTEVNEQCFYDTQDVESSQWIL